MKNERLDRLFTFLEKSPKDAFLLFALAKEYEKLDQTGKALESYLKLLKYQPDYVGAYFHLGKLYESFEQSKEAFQTYTSGMKVAKEQGDQHALSELAGARMELGDEGEF